jgi:hypothetical protein
VLKALVLNFFMDKTLKRERMSFRNMFGALIMASLSAISYGACDNSHNCTNVTIDRLVVSAEGETTIGTSGDESTLSCDAGANGYIKLNRSHQNYDAVYSLLLTAHITQSVVWVRTNDAGTCEIVYVVSDK